MAKRRAQIVFPTQVPPRLPDKPRDPYCRDFAHGDALVSLVRLVAHGDKASIDEHGTWTCPSNKELANLLNTFFGPGYLTTQYHSPDPYPVEIARDVAWAFGGHVIQEILDEPRSVGEGEVE